MTTADARYDVAQARHKTHHNTALQQVFYYNIFTATFFIVTAFRGHILLKEEDSEQSSTCKAAHAWPARAQRASIPHACEAGSRNVLVNPTRAH